MTRPKVKIAILGSGNIGIDLMFKVMRCPVLEAAMMAGIDPDSKGLALAGQYGIEATSLGIQPILANKQIEIVFDCTSAQGHLQHAPLLREAGKIAIDLTPAAVGVYVVPCVNLDAHVSDDNLNLITCGGQAAIPIVAAISRVANVSYAEIVATIASKSAGPGTRKNIDEFTRTTALGLERLGRATKGKAIIVLNPAEPPIVMRNTIYALVEKADEKAIVRSVKDMVAILQGYVPGYRLKRDPIVDCNRVTTTIEVKGAGDYLPAYAGNLDIITAAAVAIAERLVQKR